MAKIEFEDITFKEEETHVKATFMKYYYFLVDKVELEKIGKYKVEKEFIEFDASEKTATNKFNRLLEKGLRELKSLLGKDTVYIYKGSRIPLLGTNEFGIVDRDTNIIEVKAHSMCNLDCIYCSVDAGKSSGKTTDYIVQEEYLIEEFKKVARIKQHPIEVSINPQGEPLMYSRIIDLVKDLKAVNNVEIVSMNTNGLMLTEKLVDELIEAGLGRINLSLNTINQETASKLGGNHYNLEKLGKVLDYCKGKIEILVAPLIVPGYNDEQIDELLEFCKEKGIKRFGFQNYLNYKRGRNPVKQKSFDWFYDLLKVHEGKTGLKLIHTTDDYNIVKDAKIPKPFKKNEIVETRVMCKGKYCNDYICASKDRCITVTGKLTIGQTIKIKIVRDKHNIFRGINPSQTTN